jgi:hypothetical protein
MRFGAAKDSGGFFRKDRGRSNIPCVKNPWGKSKAAIALLTTSTYVLQNNCASDTSRSASLRQKWFCTAASLVSIKYSGFGLVSGHSHRVHYRRIWVARIWRNTSRSQQHS